MANGRSDRNKRDTGRDPGPFVALPNVVLDCPAYARLSHPARALLLEFARQYSGDDNGRLLASRAYLAKRGWKSADVIDRAKNELLAAGFIFQTVQGQRPNKASWFAVTWRRLDKLQGFDPGAALLFQQGAYRQTAPAKGHAPALKNAPLVPSGGPERPLIVPSGGPENAPPVPPGGTIRPVLVALPVPSGGHPLEKPSPAWIGEGVRGECDTKRTAVNQ